MGSEALKTEPVCSIDRLTILIYCPYMNLIREEFDEDEFEMKRKRVEKITSYILEDRYKMLSDDFHQGQRTKCYAKHFRTVWGHDIQLGPIYPVRKKVGVNTVNETDEDGNIIEVEKNVYEYFEPSYGLRVEYNPNKQDIREITNFFSDFIRAVIKMNGGKMIPELLKISRIDVAVDYEHSLFPELITADKMYKSFTASSKKKSVETVYFGARSSKNYFRIYDKANELREKQGIDYKGDLWRVELENKEPFLINEFPDTLYKSFQRLHFYSVAQETGDWKVDFALFYAQHFGLTAALAKMPKMTAFDFKKKLGSLTLSIEHPAEVFRLNFSNIWKNEKNKILSTFGLTNSLGLL